MTEKGVRLTKSLFWEVGKDKEKALFTFSHNPRTDLDLIPFREVYLAYCVDDPSEYTFAMEVFGDWFHWTKILENTTIFSYIKKVREERDVAIKSKAFKEIINEAKDGRSKFQAAKYLIEKGLVLEDEDEKSSKSTKNSISNIREEYKDDLKRLHLQ